MKKPAPSARPAATNDRDALVSYLGDVCADDPDLLATVHALAEANETDLLRLVRDFRDNVPNSEILRRHGPPAVLDERLRVIHRVYVDQARRVRRGARAVGHRRDPGRGRRTGPGATDPRFPRQPVLR